MIHRNEYTLNLHSLKDVAARCSYLNLAAAIIFLGLSQFMEISQEIAIMCGILAILISCYPVLYALQKRQKALLFSGITILNIAPVWFLYAESVLPGYDAFNYTQPVYKVSGFFWIAVFQLLVNFFYVLFWKKGSSFSIRSLSFLQSVRFRPIFYIRLTWLVFLVPLLFFLVYYGSLGQLWTAMTAGRSESSNGLLIRDSVGGVSSLMLPFTWIWQLTPAIACIALIVARERYRFFAWIGMVPALFVIFVFFLSGSRGIMMFVAAAPLFFLFYYNIHRGLKFWMPVSLLIVMLISLMEIQVRFRGNLLDVISNPSKAARLQDLRSITTLDPTQSQRDNNMYLFCLMLKSYPDKYSYEGFNDFFAVMANPIPRSLWPDKPILNGARDIDHQSSFVLSGPLTMGTTSLSYSIVGDAYKTDGFLGLIIYAALYCAFLLYFDGILFYAKKNNPLSIAVLGMTLFLVFWGYRALFALVSFAYPVILLLIFFRLTKIVTVK